MADGSFIWKHIKLVHWEHHKYIPVHVVAAQLGPSKAPALPAFHALTGCDTTSAFFGKGKKTAWAVWQSLPDLTFPLQLLSCPNPSLHLLSTHRDVLQLFVTQLYGVFDNDITTVDAARRHLFLHKGKDFLHMPPGSYALQQYLLKVAYQSGNLWGNMLTKAVEPGSVADWKWQQASLDSSPSPVYITIPILSNNLPELVSCKCESECKPPCSCCMHGQSCMILCTCKCSWNGPHDGKLLDWLFTVFPQSAALISNERILY